MNDEQILDLDALQPKKAYIKIGDQKIEVQQPKTSQMFRLSALGSRMENIDKLQPAQVDQLVESMTALLREIIPELGDRPLNTQQVLGVMKLVGDMVTPADAKELEQRKISPASSTGDPKDESNTSA